MKVYIIVLSDNSIGKAYLHYEDAKQQIQEDLNNDSISRIVTREVEE